MRFALLLLAFFTTTAYGQFLKLSTKPPPPGGYPEAVLKIEKANHTCVKLPTKSFATLIKKYPFNKSAQIQLASFKGDKLQLQTDSGRSANLYEVNTLQLPQIQSLTNVMYNIGFGGTILLVEELACYDPKNAIVFIDSTGNAFEFIEICFECQQFNSSSENIDFGEVCNEKFNLLKQEFIRAGVLYGTKDKK